MDRVRAIVAALRDAEFSVLGRLYLGPDRWVRANGLEYLIALACGAVVTLAAGWWAWRVASRDRTASGLYRAALILYLVTGAWTTFSYPPTTDEPHYLTISRSLVVDGDIDVANQYANREWRAFYPGDSIDPHMVIVPDGRAYSQHTAGIPLVTLPGFALLGRWGVMAILAAIAACVPVLCFRIALECGAVVRGAWTASVLVAASAPLIFGATLVFPDVTAAVLGGTGFLLSATWWGPAACAALLPWLHPRLAVLAAGLLVLNLWRCRQRGRALGAWAGFAAGSGALFFSVYHGPALVAVMNTLTEQYPAKLEELGQSTVTDNLAIRYLLPGFLGKFFDREFGWLPYAPWALTAFIGLAAAKAGRNRTRLRDLWVVFGGLALLSVLYRNWAGSAYPGRTLISLLPLAAPYLALGIEWILRTRRGGWRRVVFVMLIVVSVGLGWMLTACPVLRYTSGREWMQAKVGAAWKAFPPGWWPSIPLPVAPSVEAAQR